jgi:hypothetical protein
VEVTGGYEGSVMALFEADVCDQRCIAMIDDQLMYFSGLILLIINT